MRRQFILWLLLASAATLTAQSIPRGLQSVGAIPDDFKCTARQWYESRPSLYPYGHIHHYSIGDTLMLHSCQLANMLSSGRCLYGDPLSQWVEQQTALMGADSIRCYLYRDTLPSHAQLYLQQVLLFNPELLLRSQAEVNASLAAALGSKHLPPATDSTIFVQLQQLALLEVTRQQLLTTPTLPTYEPRRSIADNQRIAFITPRYHVINALNQFVPRRSYRRQQQLSGDVAAVCKAAKVDLVDMSATQLRTATNDTFYNDYTLVADWHIAIQHQHAPQGDTLFQRLFQRLDCSEVLVVAVDNDEGRVARIPWMATLLGTIYAPATIGAATHMFSHVEQTTISSARYHATSGYCIDSLSHVYPLKDEHDYLRATLYDNLTISQPNPGFMGGRFYLHMGIDLATPGLGSWLGRSLTDGRALRPFEINPAVGIEYSLSRHWSFALDGEGNRTRLFLSSQQYDLNSWYDMWLLNSSVTLRYYRHPCPAPVGGYLGAGITMTHLQLVEPDRILQTQLQSNRLDDLYGLRLLWGRNYMHGRHWLVNFSLSYDFPFLSTIRFFISDDPSRPFFRPDPELASVVAADVWYQNFFSLGVKIGWMP